MKCFYKVEKISIILLLLLMSTSCLSKDPNLTTSQIEDKIGVETDDEQCVRWIGLTNKIFNGKDRVSIFNIGLAQISMSCQRLPKSFKSASLESLALKGNIKLIPLFNPAKAYFSEICFEAPPTESAKLLPHICLGDDFIDGRFTALLTKIDAATYLFIKSIEIEFSKIFESEYTYQRFILNMMLSAALNKEAGWKEN